MPCAVHPRMRGEHCRLDSPRAIAIGSSPHARGTPAAPAGAATGSPVHPRMRGEHYGCDCRGSIRNTVIDVRFIPACAGNTCGCRQSADQSSPVHPRMRGEHARGRGCTRTRESGSSPHARGTRIGADTAHDRSTGSSPHARGTRLASDGDGSSPHARGTRAMHRSWTGSSPHARGTRRWPLTPCIGQRFIPACAGNTASSTLAMPQASVHPRMRGEHVMTLDASLHR